MSETCNSVFCKVTMCTSTCSLHISSIQAKLLTPTIVLGANVGSCRKTIILAFATVCFIYFSHDLIHVSDVVIKLLFTVIRGTILYPVMWAVCLYCPGNCGIWRCKATPMPVLSHCRQHWNSTMGTPAMCTQEGAPVIGKWWVCRLQCCVLSGQVGKMVRSRRVKWSSGGTSSNYAAGSWPLSNATRPYLEAITSALVKQLVQEQVDWLPYLTLTVNVPFPCGGYWGCLAEILLPPHAPSYLWIFYND